MRRSLVLVIAMLGCAPNAYTPPARFAALDSPITPAAGGTDAQIDATALGEIFGPSLNNGGARLRHAITDTVVIEGEGGVAYVTNDGTGGSRVMYTGRAGVMLLTPADSSVHGAMTVGVGGGTSETAGQWGSVDIGGVLSGRHKWIRPFIGGDVSFNHPFSPITFTVSDGTDTTTLQFAEDVTARGTMGLELGPRETTVILGMSLIQVFADSNGVIGPGAGPSRDDVFMSASIGFRAQL